MNEVLNSIKVYDQMQSFDTNSSKSFLKAREILMKVLVSPALSVPSNPQSHGFFFKNSLYTSIFPICVLRSNVNIDIHESELNQQN